MPTVSVYEDELRVRLGEPTLNPDSFQDLCFQFGLELDDVTSDYEMVRKEQGEAAAKGKSTRVIYRVDIPANRYDLLCVEGLVLALSIFKDQAGVPDYQLDGAPKKETTITVSPATKEVRQFVVCAILRDLEFDPARYESFIDLQDKLHHNICRRRNLASIGTHDLDTIQGPFTYEALPPEQIEFKPLKTQVTPENAVVGMKVLAADKSKGAIKSVSKEEKTAVVDVGGSDKTYRIGKDGVNELDLEWCNAKQLMEFYSTHQQLKAYLPIIRDLPRYPVIYDKNRTVLSLPPIINGDVSKISMNTKNVFIEVTALDLTKAKIVLNTVVANFSVYCKKQFTVEPVDVVYTDNAALGTMQTPNVTPRVMEADAAQMKADLHLNELSDNQVAEYLRKMSLPCELTSGSKLTVKVPITRSDVMHQCDLVEDLAIAYGYNNLKADVPQTLCLGSEQPLNHMTDLLRNEMASAGYAEALTFGLVSNKENFENMRRTPADADLLRAAAEPHTYLPCAVPVRLSNPKSKEFEVCRTSLLPGLLLTLMHNKKNPPPIRLFEVSDVVIQDPSKETGARNQRRVAALFGGMTSGFDTLHGALDHLLAKLNCQPSFSGAIGRGLTFDLVPSEDPSFFPGRQGNIVVNGVTIGVIGVLHPEVVTAFDLSLAVSAFELNIQPFLDWL